MTSNMLFIVAFDGGLKCTCKIYLNTQGKGRQIMPTNADFAPKTSPYNCGDLLNKTVAEDDASNPHDFTT